MAKDKQEAFETFDFESQPIRGFPELRWAGKRPFRSTQYFPAQKKESYGDPVDGWMNKIYWGDNLQVMSHLLREFRGEVDLIYIDPPFDTGVNYSKNIKLKGRQGLKGDVSAFEEKQYKDIWAQDEFAQFLHERITLCRELLSPSGNIIIHSNPHSAPLVRNICNEIFTPSNFHNEIIWVRTTAGKPSYNVLPTNTDRLTWYSKTNEYKFFPPKLPLSEKDIKSFNKDDNDGRGPYNTQPLINPAFRPNLRYIFKDKMGREWNPPPNGWRVSEKKMHELDHLDRLAFSKKGVREKYFLHERMEKGKQMPDYWLDVPGNAVHYSSESTGYPTQKPESLLKRVLESFSEEGDLVFDGFAGSGTTAASALKTNRRFICADINLGSIETMTKRLSLLISSAKDQELFSDAAPFYNNFDSFMVNNYNIFRNPLEATQLISEAMELQPLSTNTIFDGAKEEYLVKIMPVNRIATRQDLNEIITGLDFKAFEQRQANAPNKPVERIHLVCMGHEPDLAEQLKKEAKPYDIDVIITDLVRDKSNLHFKRSAEAKLAIENGKLKIAGFYPMNLLQKLSMQTGDVEDWRQLVESVKVDFNYDGAVLTPSIVDVPEKNELVIGEYDIPEDAGTIRVKITDLLSESWEGDIDNG